MPRLAGTLLALIAVGVMLLFAVPVLAATLAWDSPTTYSDGTPIAATDQSRIVYGTYTGNAASGPWTAGAQTAPGALTAILPDPAPGQTLWYTIDAHLDGQTGAKAVAVSKTAPFKTPSAPGNLRVQ